MSRVKTGTTTEPTEIDAKGIMRYQVVDVYSEVPAISTQMSMTKLSIYNTKAIQELNNKVEDLIVENKSLEARITNLEKLLK